MPVARRPSYPYEHFQNYTKSTFRTHLESQNKLNVAVVDFLKYAKTFLRISTNPKTIIL